MTPKNPITIAFETLDTNLNLNDKERRAAQKLHGDITALLIETQIATTAFLQGSFARKTMLPPLHDVDKVIVLHQSMARLTPDQVMDAIEATLAEAYPDARFPKPRSRHALKMELAGHEFHFDTVPAWDTPGSDPDRDVLIADRQTGGWKPSNTRKLISVVKQRNSDANGRFIHWVRMSKAAVAEIAGEDIPGLHVETWAFYAVTGPMAEDVAVATILAKGAELLGGSYTDPTGVDRISDRLSVEATRHQLALKTIATQAADALQLAKGGRNEQALHTWAGIFGDVFPDPATVVAAAEIGDAFHGRVLTDKGRVSTTSATGQTLVPSRAWGGR